jgi:DNA-binding MarR family transcriptional regulator
MPAQTDTALTATELRVVLGRLVRRLRAENQVGVAQVVVLGRLEREGAACVSELAAAEHMRPQSMAQTVRELEAEGLVRRRPDPADGRRSLVELTEAGATLVRTERDRREGWLAQAIAQDLSAREQDVLAEAIELLKRLSGADPG